MSLRRTWWGLLVLPLAGLGWLAWGQLTRSVPFGVAADPMVLAAWTLPDDAASVRGIKVVHLRAPGCLCEYRTQLHRGQLYQRYHGSEVHFFELSTTALTPLPGWTALPPATAAALAGIGAPGVAIFDGQNRLAYLGPYAEGYFCGSGNSWVEPVIDQLLAGKKVHSLNLFTSGCFCPWSGT